MAETKAEDVKADEVKGADVPSGLSVQDKPPAPDENQSDAETQSYLWLADGRVLRVRNEDIPSRGHLSLGHWQIGDKVFQVVAIYPVEEKGITSNE